MILGRSHSHSTPSSVGGYIPGGDDELQSSDDEFATFNPTNDLGTATSFGKSSEAVLIQAAVEMKKEFLKPDGSGPSPIGEEPRPEGYLPTHRRHKFWHPGLVNLSSTPTSPRRSLTSSGSGLTLNPMHQNHNTTSQILTYFQPLWITTSHA